MPRSSNGRKTRNLSLQPDHELAMQYLREEAGIGGISPIMQELIERRMLNKLGEDWREIVREWAANREEAVA